MPLMLMYCLFCHILHATFPTCDTITLRPEDEAITTSTFLSLGFKAIR